MLWLAVALLAVAAQASCAVRPAHLTAEYLVDPLGLDNPAPRLGWWVVNTEAAVNQSQSAYRIQAATTVRSRL